MQRRLVVAAFLAGLAVLVPAGGASSEAESDKPTPYRCIFNEHYYQPFHDIECPIGTSTWELLWYYPPGVYQVWCFLTYDCPCPQCPAE